MMIHQLESSSKPTRNVPQDHKRSMDRELARKCHHCIRIFLTSLHGQEIKVTSPSKLSLSLSSICTELFTYKYKCHPQYSTHQSKSNSCFLLLSLFLQTKASPVIISFLTHHRGSLEVIQASTRNTYGSGGTRCSLSTWSQVSWSRAEHFRGCQSVPSILTRSLGCSEAIQMVAAHM